MNDRASLSSPRSKERLRGWLRLLKTTRFIEAELRERMRLTFGTTLPRFDVLAALHRAQGEARAGAPAGLRMSELSGTLRVSNGNVTGLVDRLVEDGLVRRDVVEGDRRSFRVCLTEAGRAHFEEMAAIHEVWVDELLSPIDAEGLETIMTRLARVTERPADRQGSIDR